MMIEVPKDSFPPGIPVKQSAPVNMEGYPDMPRTMLHMPMTSEPGTADGI